MEEDSIVTRIAIPADVKYVYQILDTMEAGAKERGTGIARRPVQYLCRKIYEGKAVIAFTKDLEWVGFSYLESWSNEAFVSNSGLIVHPEFRGAGIASRIKKMIFDLSKKLYPKANIFSITTGAAVLKLNFDLGFQPVTFSDITKDEKFWEQCKSCANHHILESTNRKMCLCTAMVRYSNVLES
jgi:GNAT superfamily N-acetyltransferase